MARDVLPRHPLVYALALALLAESAARRPADPEAASRAASLARRVAQTADTAVAVEFQLSDQFGRVHDAAEYRGRALLLVGAGNGGREAGTAWVEALRGLQVDSAGAVAVPVVAVADMRGLPRLLRRLARGKFPKDRRQPVLLDWDGALARRLGLERERCTILVVGPSGRPHARSSPDAVDTSVARALLRQAAELTPPTGPATQSR